MSEHVIEIETSENPTASVIWLHGLGADGNDFVPVIPQLDLPSEPGLRFIFPSAPLQPVSCNGGYVMRSWYDIYTLDGIGEEDRPGLAEAQHTVESLIQTENERGIKTDRVFLMGFSQGGAVALHTGLRHPQRLAGIGALSTYLPLRNEIVDALHAANTDVPIFMAHGIYDPVVRYAFGESSCQLLQQLGYRVNWRSYPMEHSVCPEEIADISAWITRTLSN